MTSRWAGIVANTQNLQGIAANCWSIVVSAFLVASAAHARHKRPQIVIAFDIRWIARQMRWKREGERGAEEMGALVARVGTTIVHNLRHVPRDQVREGCRTGGTYILFYFFRICIRKGSCRLNKLKLTLCTAVAVAAYQFPWHWSKVQAAKEEFKVCGIR